MRSSSSDDNFLDRGFADQARLSFAPVYAVPKLKKAFFAVSIDVV